MLGMLSFYHVNVSDFLLSLPLQSYFPNLIPLFLSLEMRNTGARAALTIALCLLQTGCFSQPFGDALDNSLGINYYGTWEVLADAAWCYL